MKDTAKPTTAKPNIAGIAVDILTVALIYVVAQIIVALLMVGFGVRDATQLAENPGLVVVAYIVSGIVTLGFTFWVMKLRKIDRSILSIKKYQLKDFGYALVGFFVYLAISLTLVAVLRQIPGINLDQEQDLGLDGVTGALVPLTFIALVVVTPIVEEVLFRGLLYGRLKYQRVGMVAAALITSLAFGFVHGQLNVGIDTFVLSMVMIFMLEKRKNLWVTITMHAIKNLLAFLVLFVFKIA